MKTDKPERKLHIKNKSAGAGRSVRPTDPDAFSNPDSARVRARQLGCIGIRRYNATTGGYVWMPCTNESDYRREMGTSNSGRLQRRREIQNEVRRFVRGKTSATMSNNSDFTQNAFWDVLEEKAIGRAIGRSSGSIGRRVRNAMERFNPDAVDADADRLVQEGTSFERPDTPNVSGPDDAPPRGIPRPDLPNEDDAPPRGIPRPSTATRVRNFERGLVGANTSKFNANYGDYSEGKLPPNALQPNPSTILFGSSESSKAQQVLQYAYSEGLYFKRRGKGDHSQFAKDIVLPDGTIETREITIAPKMTANFLRDQLVRSGFIKNVKGLQPSEFAKATRKYKLNGEQKKSIDGAISELVKIDPSTGDITEFPGVRSIHRRSQEIAQSPIRYSDVRGYIFSDDSGMVPKSIQKMYSEAEEINGRIDTANIVYRRTVIDTAERSNNTVDQFSDPNIYNKIKGDAAQIIYDTFVPDQEKKIAGRPAALKANIKKQIDQIFKSDYFKNQVFDGKKQLWQLWSASTDLDSDPMNSMSIPQRKELEDEINRLPFDSTGPSLSSDTDLVNTVIKPLIVDPYGMNVPTEVFDSLIDEESVFEPFAKYRNQRIADDDWTDDSDAARGLLGGMSGSDRGDGKKRFARREARVYSEGGIVGRMSSADDRRKDFNDKKRNFHVGMLSQVLSSNPDDSPFRKFLEKFGFINIDDLRGTPDKIAYSNRQVEMLFNEMTKEWPEDTMGKRPSFVLWDAPMSTMDIENLADQKRLIIGEFLKEAKSVQAGGPFDVYDINSMSDADVDTMWRLYALPELSKQVPTLLPNTDIPFDIDPDKVESIRNYAEYLAMSRAGLNSGLDGSDIDDALQDIITRGPAQQWEEFVDDLNKTYDAYKKGEPLPGGFLVEDLIDPNTGNIWTQENWREALDDTSTRLMEASSKFAEAADVYAQEYEKFQQLMDIGYNLKYLTEDDQLKVGENVDEVAENLEEVDPLEGLNVSDLTFDPGTRSGLASFPGLSWLWRTFARDAKDFAYPLAEKYHANDIQQHRYAPPPEEFTDLDKIDWGDFLKVFELAEAGDEEADFPGTKTILSKARERKAAKLLKERKDYSGPSQKSKTNRSNLWSMFETDGLTPQEIAAKSSLETETVTASLKRHSKDNNFTVQQYNSISKTNRLGFASREEQFLSDEAASTLSEMKKRSRGGTSSYLDDLRVQRAYYKNIEKQANASYSQSRRRYAELATLGYWLLEGLPQPGSWDRKKETEASFKNRWLTELSKREEALVLITNQMGAIGLDRSDRRSASSRVLERAERMVRGINDEIEKIEKALKIEERESIKQRLQIQAISDVKNVARQAVRGAYPNITDDEIDDLLSSGGLTGAMGSSLRGATRGKKARNLAEYSSRNSSKKPLLRRAAESIPSLRNKKKEMAIIDWLSDEKNLVPTVSLRKRNRAISGSASAESTPAGKAKRAFAKITRQNRQDYFLGRSESEKEMIEELGKNARKAKVDVVRYLDGRDDAEDVKWSSNDWSYGKTSPINGADMVIYRMNPKEKDPERAIEVLVIERKSGPFTGANALPGGLHDPGETLLETAMREMTEEVGIERSQVIDTRNLGIIRSRDWDPRFVEGVTVQGVAAKVPYDTSATAGSDAKKAKFVPLSEILSGNNHIAFGHAAFLKEAFKDESPKSAKKLGIHERASRIRNRRLIEQINTNRKRDGQKLFDLPSDEEIAQPFKLIRPDTREYKDISNGLKGAISERYDIKQNQDGEWEIIDTQNNNMRIAGPFKSRKQALYGAIRKDKDSSFNPQILVRKKRVAPPKINEPEALPTSNQLSFDFDEGLSGKMTGDDLRKELNLSPVPMSLLTSELNQGADTMNTLSRASTRSAVRDSGLWTPYKTAVTSVVPDSERTQTPTFFILGGPPASFKTEMRLGGWLDLPNRNQAITLDPDEAKSLIPEYEEYVQMKRRDAASLVHGESKHMTERALSFNAEQELESMRQTQSGKDFVYDSSGQLQSSSQQFTIGLLRKSGYKVVGYYFFLNDAEMGKRINKRRRETGRSVSVSVAQSIQSNLSSLEDNEDVFDEIYFYDTSDPQNIRRFAVWQRASLAANSTNTQNTPIPDSDRFTNAQVDKTNKKSFKVSGARGVADEASFFTEDLALVQEHLARSSARWI